MEILRYIKDDYVYVSMLDRLKNLEMKNSMIESQLCILMSQSNNSWEHKMKIDNALASITNVFLELGIDSNKLNRITDALKEVL